MHRILVAVLVALLGVWLSGCVSQPEKPSDCAQASVTRDATLTLGGLQPRDIDVCRGQRVALSFGVQVDGVLHIHGYDEQAREVRVGQSVTFTFTAVRSGQFVIELHTTTQPNGLNMGVFTVHEP